MIYRATERFARNCVIKSELELDLNGRRIVAVERHIVKKKKKTNRNRNEMMVVTLASIFRFRLMFTVHTDADENINILFLDGLESIRKFSAFLFSRKISFLINSYLKTKQKTNQKCFFDDNSHHFFGKTCGFFVSVH